MKSSAVDGKLTKTMRAEDGEERDEGVVAKVHEVTGKDTAGASPHEGKDDAKHNENGHKAPGPTELGAVHETEEQAGQENSGPNAERAGKKGVQVAAEKGLLHERSDKDGHGHEHEGNLAVLEELLHRKILGSFHAGGQERDKKRQTAAGRKVDEGIARQLAGTLFERAPTKRFPKGAPAEERERHVAEEENCGVPDQHAANGKLRLGEEIFLELGSGQVFVPRNVVSGQDALNENQAGKAEEDKQDEMGPGPGDLQIFRIGADGRKEWSFLLGE